MTVIKEFFGFVLTFVLKATINSYYRLKLSVNQDGYRPYHKTPVFCYPRVKFNHNLITPTLIHL